MPTIDSSLITKGIFYSLLMRASFSSKYGDLYKNESFVRLCLTMTVMSMGMETLGQAFMNVITGLGYIVYFRK